MKKTILVALVVMLTSVKSFAHYLWIETNSVGKVGNEQAVKVYFGEYTHGLVEEVKGDAYAFVKDFTLWVVDGNGNKTEITVNPKDDAYVGYFTPKTKGIYTVVLDNNNINVIDYTKYDFGIFKTHYHAVAKVTVGNNHGETVADNNSGITLKDISKNKEEVVLQVLFKNEPLVKGEVKVFVADQWTKTLKTDANGTVSFKLPWKTKYIVEVTNKEEVSGTFKGDKYEFIWHCVTYSIL